MDQNFCLFWNDRIGEERKKEKNFSLFLSFSMLHFFFTQTTLFVISSNFCQNFRIEMQNRTWGEEEEVELNFFLSSFVFLSKFSLSLKFSEEVAFIISKIRTSKKESINCAWDWTKGLLIRNSHLYLFLHIRSFVASIDDWDLILFFCLLQVLQFSFAKQSPLFVFPRFCFLTSSSFTPREFLMKSDCFTSCSRCCCCCCCCRWRSSRWRIWYRSCKEKI